VSGDWRESMGPASFRGVPFYVETSEFSGGRRGTTHEYPFKKDVFREDLGRKVRTFTVEGYVIGDGYFGNRDALLEALESEKGPGPLVHPYHGNRQVAVDTFRVRETKSEGGWAQFSIEFIETPAKPAQPSSVVDAPGALASSASLARSSVGAEFLKKYDPGVLLASASASVRSAVLAISDVTSVVTGSVQSAALLKHRIDSTIDNVLTIIAVPQDLLDAMNDLFDLFEAPAAGTNPIKMLDIYDFDAGIRPPATTPNRIQEQTNYDAIQYLVQRLTVIRAVELAPSLTFDNYEQATRHRDALTDLIDDQADVASDDTYPDLLQMRADLARAVPGDESDLPRLVSYTPAATVPSLVLAQRLYGNVDLEADLVDRNRVRHPGFVPGASALEVLSDG
jgi:prophage DNA circulation protein